MHLSDLDWWPADSAVRKLKSLGTDPNELLCYGKPYLGSR
jgi:hypothetical protein